MTISYKISPASLHAHLFHVSISIKNPDPAGQCVCLPAWIPGSYLIREFARNIVEIRAESAGNALALTKSDKHTWQAEPVIGPLEIHYSVYAWDLSVRGAYLDQTRGFFNGTSVFLAVKGQEKNSCNVEIIAPEGKEYKNWKIATTLPAHGAKQGQFGRYQAADYDELIDHPVEMGEFSQISFKACGIPHDIVIAGRHNADLKRLKKDLKQICEYQIRLFGEPAPFDRYLFMTMALGDGYGGLEHRSSTALMCNRDDLPFAHETQIKTGYRQFLGLCSHEYFHSWNVKRIKPAAYAPYDLSQENYTRLLWAFEGVTSYYDDLTLVRTGLISPQEYLDLLAQTVTGVQRGHGRTKQTLAESSFDTWVKFYRQDENSPNSLVSYYAKGALTALCLDLLIRQQTSGQKSLDDVMRALWQRYGKDFATHGEGVAEEAWEALASEVSGLDLKPFFDLAIRSTAELPLQALLADFGVDWQLRAAVGAADKGGWLDKELQAVNSLGVRTSIEGSFVKLSHVLDGGAAQQSGLSAGDLLIAMNHLRVTSGNLDGLLASQPTNGKVEVLAFRRDELMQFDVHLQHAEANTCGLRLNPLEDNFSITRNAWLKG
ncbi:M61 family metallopeptidase [Iodobacter sp. HSC-16F04]|uniref:M61 family metallopeptidase n=1 Tax=Iodobacter violaceini TaxID=3044271 RepID=A0ABX0KUL9_9NEIS|nr:M61 family metallopeptidase [Iodobacter violacea]NHQ88405.1 M61 family metallopeptidase [Iodobacter violacea]